MNGAKIAMPTNATMTTSATAADGRRSRRRSGCSRVDAGAPASTIGAASAIVAIVSREGPPWDARASGAKPEPAGDERERGRKADTQTTHGRKKYKDAATDPHPREQRAQRAWGDVSSHF